MSITNDNVQISSSIPSGATMATDIVSDGVHIQEVKLNIGGEGQDTLLSSNNPAWVTPSSDVEIWFPVAGSTDGSEPVDVNIVSGASITVAGVTIFGGCLDTLIDGVSADIRSVAAGISIGVSTIGSEKVTVTGDVKLLASTNNIGDVDVLTVAIPAGTGVTTGKSAVTSTAAALPSNTFETGFRITNFGPNTAYIGPTTIAGTLTADGYPLQQYDSLFIEATGAASMSARCNTSETADLRIIGS
jgi:hypothetical protein